MPPEQIINYAISSAVGALIAAVALIVNGALSRAADERRQRRELSLKAAVSNWEQDTRLAVDIAKAKNTTVSIPPLDSYLVYWLQMSSVIERRNLTPEVIRHEIERIKEITKGAYPKPNEKKQ